LSTTQAKHLLHDSEALQQKEAESPPRELSFSISVKGIPDWANSKATVIPEIPPPMIRTSPPDDGPTFSVNSLLLGRFSFRDWNIGITDFKSQISNFKLNFQSEI
jgi:hypothetical protein